ncbi:recombination-associated protein RdgC [Allopusillimonas soli]|uniref:Recombination-associated protein RdgC n=1 Tax=Allopusillimonas soli TaxID=659016 RepID=A0A853FLX6_9BURK|nr:recombination-associated protein RdgC [Allopusillimonas soli]NYT38906.1 recombination-associated protein RdgC [Allopusillimonas soli]TEA70096.1 recombination-associated protein RdgC [Allopusillimonas soli]
MWFKNLKIYRLAPSFALSADELEQKLAQFGYRPIGGQEMQSMGWVPPREDLGLVYSQDGQYLLCLRTAKKLLPASVVNRAARDRAGEIAQQQGFMPGRRQMREIKEQITDELLPKAFFTETDTQVWIDTRNRLAVIDTAAAHRADVVLGMLGKAIGPFPLLMLQVNQAPAAVMTNWLCEDAAPEIFSIDQDTELKSLGQARAKVRYQHVSVEPQEVHQHIQSGKQCTRLALTWSDRVSFILTADLTINRIAALDILKEGQGSERNAIEAWEGDFALMTGELASLINDIVAALGGEMDSDLG